MPAADEMLTIDARPVLRSSGAHVRMPRNVPSRFTRNNRSKPSTVSSSILTTWWTAALFTNTSTRPKVSTVTARASAHASSSVTSRCTKRRVLAEVLRDRLALIVEDVGDHDLRAFAHEQPCFGLALPTDAPLMMATLSSSLLIRGGC